MTFSSRLYVPILKLKRGEKQALSHISPGLRQYVVPLLEVVKRTQAPTVEKHLATGFKDLASSLAGYSRCLLDVREIETDGPYGASEAFSRAEAEGIPFTPMTGISRTADVPPAIGLSSKRGVGIRLTLQEFENHLIPNELNRFLSTYGLTPDRVDLVVDLGSINDLITAGAIALTQAFLAVVPYKSQWRTLTVTASSFPISMAVVSRNSSGMVERSDWLAWRHGLFDHRATLERLPTYSDCAIQHPIGVEDFDPRFMRVSASIRYVSGIDWLLVKGESTRNNPPTIQFPQLATRLVYGQLRNSFAGSSHCHGCKLAKDSADGMRGLGSAEVWRRIGTIHHITTVVQDDLGSLPSP